MRALLQIISENKPIPFNYQSYLTGAIHKWLGPNDIHGKLSLYSFSWLNGGRKYKDHLIFDHRTSLDFSCYNPQLLQQIIRGIKKDPSINFGLTVTDIILQETPLFSHKETFHPASPILVKKRLGDQNIHYLYQDPLSDEILTETLKNKLRYAGLPDNNVHIHFCRTHSFAKTKIIYYNKIGNKVNLCPLTITGSPEQIAFAWNVGIGHSTGVGFGAIK